MDRWNTKKNKQSGALSCQQTEMRAS